MLDTTVLRYAVGNDHRFLVPCEQLVAAIRAGRTAATTTAEVIQEFAWGRAGRRGRPEAVELASDCLDLLSPLVQIDEPTVREGLRLFERHPSLGSFDAMLAAVAVATGAEALVSTHAAFAEVRDLRHIVPDHAGSERLLA